jgi:hypothetical protein
MKISLEKNMEWGFTIDPRNFLVVKLVDEIPEGFFFIMKRREYLEEISRTIVRNRYGLIKKGEIHKLNKREMSDYLSISLAKFILRNYSLPKGIKIEQELKYMKPAKFAFSVGNYDIFHLSVDATDLEGKNPKEILDLIIQKSDKNLFKEKKEIRWKIEYAKSSIAKCRKCSTNIDRDTVRLGEPSYYQEHLSFRWYHEDCIDWSKFTTKTIAGLEELRTNDKKRIEKKLSK